MKHLVSITAAGIVILAFAVTGAATNAESLSLHSQPVVAPSVAAPAPVVESDANRRRRLNLRLQEMVLSGQGARLADGKAAPRRSVVNRPNAAPTIASAARPVASQPSSRHETSTISPPAATRASLTTGGRYRSPILDLMTAPVIPTNDLECLTQALYYEARNESEQGQAAVAEVVLNRSRSGAYPKSVCQVVYQRNSRTCQFTFTCDGSIGRGAVNMSAWARAERIARGVFEGSTPLQLPANSVNYHANYVRPSWGRQLQRVRQIGAHIFYGAALSGHTTPGAKVDQPTTIQKPGLQFVRIDALDRAVALMSPPQTPLGNP